VKTARVLALSAIFFGLSAASFAQTPQLTPTGTALEQGLWWLYHLQYDQARKLFTEYTTAHPNDPAGYFYKTAADWWQLAQQFDQDLPEVRQRLDDDFQATVKVAENLLDTKPDDKTKGMACLYKGGAQGLKGRWLVTQGQWVKAYFLGKNGHKMLKRALEYDSNLYDAYLGLGIYDYYTDTLPGIQKVLAALLIHGDKARGLKELQWAIEKGEHARVEAMMFLIEIYTWEEKTPEKALEIAQRLHAEYPKSPAMYLAEIIDYYELHQWDKLTEEAQDYLVKSLQQADYYPREGRFPAWYCIGIAAFWGGHDADQALLYMNKIIAEETNPSSRWLTFAYLRAAQANDVKGQREQALALYRKVLDRPDFWGSHNEAKHGIKDPVRF
jgi:tetratricopeptide (TPR) repeat protein